MHAEFWCSPRFNTDLAWLAKKGTGVADGGAGFVKMALDKHQDKFDNDFKQLAKFYIENAKQIIIALKKGPKTLNFGDAAIKNTFYDPAKNNVGLVDFGLVNASPEIIDVSYLITNALLAKVRVQAEKDLLRNYCATLAERGVEYDFNTAWDKYRFSIIYSWLAAAATAGVGSKRLPLELSLDATARLTQACKGLDTQALVTNELK